MRRRKEDESKNHCGGGIPTKLGWLHQYTFGSADAQSTTFSRETEEDRTTYSQNLYLSVDHSAINGERLPLLQELAAENADDALRTESTVQKAVLAAEFFTADAVQKCRIFMNACLRMRRQPKLSK